MVRGSERRRAGEGLNRELPAWIGRLVDAAGLAMIALFLWGFVGRNFLAQADLKTYRFAGRAVLAGLDPYVVENLSRVAGHPVFPFIYPPIHLLPCLAIAEVPWQALALAWMCGKIAILSLLIFAWAKWINREPMVLPMALVA